MEKAVFTPKVLIFRKNGNFFRQNEFYNIACKMLAICFFMWYIEQNQCGEAIFCIGLLNRFIFIWRFYEDKN